MKKFATTLLIMVLSSPLFAVTNPSVTLNTTTFSNPFPLTFQVAVTFSEPVTGFGPTDINVTNGNVVSVTGAPCQPTYVVVIQPLATGEIDILIPAGVVTSRVIVKSGVQHQAAFLSG